MSQTSNVDQRVSQLQNVTYTRGATTSTPNKYSQKAYVLKRSEQDGGIVLPRPVINFMRQRWIFYIISILVMGTALGAILIRGLNLGLDFTGGTVLEVHFAQVVDGPSVAEKLATILSGLDVANSAPTDLTIRIPAKLVTDTTAQDITAFLQANVSQSAQVISAEFVGPKAGADLVYASIMSLIFTIVMILVYVSFRFQWRLSLGAVGALIHDTLVTIGFFALFQLDVDLNFVAAILSVIGYSINDTIVVFDRMRDNIRKLANVNVVDCINISLTETIPRTLMTSITTLIVVVILFLFGGASLQTFSLAMLVGIVFGTYSSIYIAVALAFDMKLQKEHMIIAVIDKDSLYEYES